jgi:hypothetical protein
MQKFSFDYYRHMVGSALEQGYVVSSFAKFDPANRRTVILRHDVDYTLNGVYQLAELEAGLGVSATYMFRVHAHEYNLFAPHVLELVRWLKASGHEIGLHYEATSVAQALGLDPIALLRKEIAALELLTEAPVRSGSEHRDISHVVHEARYLHDLCDPSEFFQFWAMSRQYSKDMKYLSDSNGIWREGDLTAHLGQHDRFQVLVHPDWWFEKHLLLKGPYFHGRGN